MQAARLSTLAAFRATNLKGLETIVRRVILKCWAHGVGGCEGKISAEHIISKSLFKEKNIAVKGFSWCQENYVTVGLSSLTRNILCEKHNSLLSIVDSGGVEVARALEWIIKICAERQTKGWGEGNVLHSTFSGRIFERWLLKTAINVSFRGQEALGVGMSDAQPGRVPAYLLEVVFGRMDLSYGMGLYAIVSDGVEVFTGSEMVIAPIQKDGEIGGFYFSLYSFDFILSLLPTTAPPPKNLRSIGVYGFPDHVLDGGWFFHPTEIVCSQGSRVSHGVRLSW